MRPGIFGRNYLDVSKDTQFNRCWEISNMLMLDILEPVDYEFCFCANLGCVVGLAFFLSRMISVEHLARLFVARKLNFAFSCFTGECFIGIGECVYKRKFNICETLCVITSLEFHRFHNTSLTFGAC